MKAGDDSSCSISMILLYRASLSQYLAAEFHHACDGIGKCFVVVKAGNGRIAAFYNEDGFNSDPTSTSPNRNGFIASVADDGGCGEVFHRNNDREVGIRNHPWEGPTFGNNPHDLFIWDSCQQEDDSSSTLCSYGRRGVYPYALFGQEEFGVVDYEVYKVVIE
jgi:hypothetical protein